jgi:hypothetical protein
MYLLFAGTLFTSAFLIFWIQPMVAKMVQPLLGGTPAVWTTCMLFFQVILLCGYFYAHLISTKLSIKKQVITHIFMLLLGILLLPIIISESKVIASAWDSNPVFWLLWLLIIVIGYPFFMISSSAPLLQKWFSNTSHVSAEDPYFLYVASNFGSIIALLSYPFIIEPTLRLRLQSQVWTFVYYTLILLFAICGVIIWRQSKTIKKETISSTPQQKKIKRLSFRRRLRWLLLAFIPSSLMLGVTTYLTIDIASIPLLWIIPLTLYLISFIFVFAKRQLLPHETLVRLFPIITLVVVFIILTEIDSPLWLVFLFYLTFFFLTAMVCHEQLAKDRPHTQHLTEFYLFISLGGALGGFFNALLAPIIFTKIIELPLVLVIACLVYKKNDLNKPFHVKLKDYLLPLALGGLTIILVKFVPGITLEPYQLWMVVIFGIPLFISYLFIKRPIRFGLSLGAILLGSSFFSAIHGPILFTERNFFGTVQVNYDPSGPYHKLFHGTTLHGIQFTNPSREDEPLSYYHREGPFGQIFKIYNQNPSSNSIAIIGLGIGSMLAYSSPNQDWTFYEIDPAVIQIANNSKYFTFLKNSKPGDLNIIRGDARINIKKAAAAEYGIIVIDAFSSDAIPVHLITEEAVTLYLSKLAKGGILAFHISNQFLDLSSVIGDLASNAGLICLLQDDNVVESIDRNYTGKYASKWAVMAEDISTLRPLLKDKRWHIIYPRSHAKPWTDDFSNILDVLKWF